MIGACQGLHSMHCMGVAHRDVSPENVFIGDDGYGAIGDFGMTLDCWVHRPKPMEEKPDGAVMPAAPHCGTRGCPDVLRGMPSDGAGKINYRAPELALALG